MNAFLVLCRREIQDRRMYLLAGVASGVVALLIPLVPGVSRWKTSDIQLLAAAALAVLLVAAGAILVGGSLFTRDLAERRTGFWLARPVGETAVWAGKLAGGFLAVLGTGFAALVPALLLNLPTIPLPWLPPDEPFKSIFVLSFLAFGALLILGVLLPFLLVNAATLMARSRSSWAVLDGAGVLLSALFLWLASRPLESSWFGRAVLLKVFLQCAALVLLAALLFASWRQVAGGRADIVAAHRASSLALWGVTLPVFAASIGIARWFVNPAPEDLRELSVVPAGATGRCVSVSGPARARLTMQAAFLLDTGSGKAIRIPDAAWSSNPAVSGDGRYVAWLRTDRNSDGAYVSPQTFISWLRTDGNSDGVPERATLFVADLDAASPLANETKISVPPARSLALSPAGDRVAFISGNLVSVVEIATARELVAARLDGLESRTDWLVDASFVSPEVVRIHARLNKPTKSTAFRIYRLDVGSRRVERTGEVTGLTGLPWVHVDPAGTSLLLEERTSTGSPVTRVTLRDGWTGAERRVLASETGGDKISTRAAFLPDGRPIIAVARPDRTVLRIFTPSGDLEREVALSGARNAWIAGALASGDVVLSTMEKKGDKRTWKTFVVNPGTGAVRALPEGLMSRTLSAWVLPTSAPASASDPARAFTFLDVTTGALVRLDPATGARTTLLPGGK